MSNVLEFFVKMKDMMSSGLAKIATNSDTTFNKVQNATNKALGRTVALGNEYDRLTSKINKAGMAAEKMRNGSGGMLGNFVKGNLIAGGIQNVVGKVKDFVTGSFDKALQNKGLSNALNTTTGGHGAAAMAQTKSISDKYGIDYESSLEGVKTLTGGLMSMNMPLKEQMKIFEGVSAGVAAMGLTADQSKGAMLALGQMASKGTVSAEELRGQLGERIPGAFGLAAKAMGVTESALNGMLQKGEIAAKDFLPKLAAQMQKTFGADALKNANGPQAITNRFNNALYEMQVTLGQGLMPIITPLLEVFTKLANEVLPFINSGLSQVVAFVSGINIQSGEWAFYIDWIKQYVGVIWDGLSYIAGIVWNILKGVFQWASKSVLIKDIFTAVGVAGEVIWWAIKKIGDAIGWIWDNLLKPILDAIEAAYKWVKEMLGLGGKGIKIVGEVNGNVKNTSVSLVQAGTMPGSATSVAPSRIMAPKAGSALTSQNNDVAKGVTSGGPKTLVVNVQKFVENLNISAANVNDGIDQIERKFEEMFLRVLNSGAAIQ